MNDGKLKNSTIVVRVSTDTLHRLHEAAAKLDVSISYLVRDAIREAMNKENKR